VLQGESGPVRDIVLLNAAAGLVAFELASDPEQGRRSIVERLREKMTVAARTIDSGAATATLDAWATATRH
jgi:anthranilate phosphoribosyltransferase